MNDFTNRSGKRIQDRPQKYLRVNVNKYARILRVDHLKDMTGEEQTALCVDIGVALINALKYFEAEDRTAWNDFDTQLTTAEGKKMWEAIKGDCDYSLSYYERLAGA